MGWAEGKISGITLSDTKIDRKLRKLNYCLVERLHHVSLMHVMNFRHTFVIYAVV